MSNVAIIYCGLSRAWEKCRDNQRDNLKGETFFCTDTVGYNCFFYDGVFKYENRAGETHQTNVLNMWHNRFIAFSVVKPGYDVYCLSRTDITFDGPVSFNECKDGEIYIPEGNDYREGINDQFCYGTYNAIKDYVSLYLKFEKYYEQGVLFHPETMLLHHLTVLGYKIHRINVKQQIVRE